MKRFPMRPVKARFTRLTCVEDVRSYVLNAIQCSAAFGEGGADVTLK